MALSTSFFSEPTAAAFVEEALDDCCCSIFCDVKHSREIFLIIELLFSELFVDDDELFKFSFCCC